MERTWFSEVTGERNGRGIVNVNREVNCKVNEFATESTEAQILKGSACVLVNNTRECARHWSLIS